MYQGRGLFRAVERKIDATKIIYPLFLFLCITTSIVPLMLAYDLIRLDSYDAFITLLDKFYIPMSYFCKIIIQNLDYMNFNVLKVLRTLLTSLSYMNLIMIVLGVYLWAASLETYMKKRNRSWVSIVLIYFLAYLIIALIIIFGFQLTSLNAIISLFFYAGIIMMSAHILIILISVYNLWKEGKCFYEIYRNAQLIKNQESKNEINNQSKI